MVYYASGSKTSRVPGNFCGTAHAQLMSAPASPGRTWRTRIPERELPLLAGAAAAGIFRSGDRGACLPNSDLPPATALHENLGSENDPGNQRGDQPGGDGHVDCFVVPVSLSKTGQPLNAR